MRKAMKAAAALTAAVMLVLTAGCGTGNGGGEGDPSVRAEDARVSYLGPAGTYTEEAAQFFFPAGVFQPQATVAETIGDVVNGEADYAVIPQENTLGGAVTGYVDALIGEEAVRVAGEVILPISQTLMGVPGASLEDIRTVCSHAQGIAQSAAWKERFLPGAVTREMASTAAAASYVAEIGEPRLPRPEPPLSTASRCWRRTYRSPTPTRPASTS